MQTSKIPQLNWRCTGEQFFPEMLEIIGTAKKSIRLESYIYSDGQLGRRFLTALLAAAGRGVQVRVLVDAVGSWLLPANYFHSLIAAGAEVRRFNPLHLWRFGVRNHRKLLVCDECIVFIGGFNVADEYDGDGVTRGWCDVGVRILNPALAEKLAASFEGLFALADFHHKPFLRLRAFKRRHPFSGKNSEELLLCRPGRGASPFQSALYRDLATASDVRIISAYFLPTRRLRRDLMHVVRRGGRVQLILAGKSDVPLSRMAARSLYHVLLKAGVEIYEYQPQVLHAKLVFSDGAVYVGSANLDIRSLNLNYELMLRFENKIIAAEALEIFERARKNCRRIDLGEWHRSQNWWTRCQNHWAHFLLARIDPFVALRQFRALKN